ncbi:MAG: NAD(P)H-hydrate dehydratase [Anaerolineaceae bacterium]|nr:NAD(P)H-hydrate dehydratase [Anaerolineaceae bacterium]
MKLVTVSEMRQIEQEANAGGLTFDLMMQNAGRGLARIVENSYSHIPDKLVLGLVGTGNNGGDTLVALAALARDGWQARAFQVRPRPADDPLIKEVLDAGGVVFEAGEDPNLKMLDGWLNTSPVWLDGILGTGTQLPLKPDLARLLSHISSFKPRAHVVAVDCPSGVDCDRGDAAPELLPAEITVCMAAIKTGLLAFPAFKSVGRLEVVDIGLADGLKSWQAAKKTVISRDWVHSILPERQMDSHKGTFGTAMVIAGSINYTGAALLAGKAAYRIGAGLVRIGIPGPLHAALAGQLPEATWLILPHATGVISQNAYELVVKNLEKVTALLIGPGLGLEETTGEFIKELVSGKNSWAGRGSIGFVTSSHPEEPAKPFQLPPLVFDADGLKLLAKIPDWDKHIPAPAVLTPHPGEMAVLTGLDVAEIQKDRLGLSRSYAEKWNHVVVLKGALTVIASPDGRQALIPVATSALAHAGTGDVLSGIIVGLRAQGLPAFEAAAAGAWIHAQAGLAAAGRIGHPASVLAGDVLESIPAVLKDLG